VFDVIRQAHHHTFQILIKRAVRMAAFCHGRTVPPNPWLGVCVENRKYGLPPIDLLHGIDATIPTAGLRGEQVSPGEEMARSVWVVNSTGQCNTC
jgi:protein gp37